MQKNGGAAASTVHALAVIPDLFSPGALEEGLRRATVERVGALLTAMEAADSELGAKMGDLLRSICPKVDRELAKIEKLIQETLKSIAVLKEIMQREESAQLVKETCEKEIAAAE